MCHRILDQEDQGYRPAEYSELLLCEKCGRDFRKLEAGERRRRGRIVVKICKCGCLLEEPYLDMRKKFHDSKWTRQKVLEEIRTVMDKGRVNRCYRENRALYMAAARRFGNWRNAIRAARTPSSR